MILDLKKILADRSGLLPFKYEMDMSQVEVDNVHPFVSPVKIEGAVTGKSGFAELKFTASFHFSVPCDRCARQIEKDLCYPFSHILVVSLENDNDDRFVEVHDERLNLDELAREDILLQLPTKFLCKEDCKGICPVCGKNLNDGPCGCNIQQTDTRFDMLKNLIH